MHCDEVRDKILESSTENQSADERASLQEHLVDCATCRGFQQQARDLQQAARRWRDEDVPNWHRMQTGFRPKPKVWMTWLPLAACLFLTALVLFRTEISWQKDGFRVSFGATSEGTDTELIQAEWRGYVDRALGQNLAQNAVQIQKVFYEFQTDQETYVQDLVYQLSEGNKRARAEEMQAMLDTWQGQREEDLRLMELQINTLLTRQNRNANNIYSLANYVNKVPTYLNQKEKL